MAFGKRSVGDPPPAPPAVAFEASEDTLLSAPGIGAIRTRVANPGSIDRKFIALAIGVVILAGGAAIALPSLGSVFSGGMRPIEDVVAGLDRASVRTALAAEAFPDADGRAFMTTLGATFPREHAQLLDTVTDIAMNGGDRDDLYSALNAWSLTFVPAQLPAIGRTGARGFDAGVVVLDDVLGVVEKEVGGCTGAKFQQVSQPEFLERLTRFDGPAYHTAMRANRAFVDLAAAGRTLPAISTTLTANDTSVIQSTFFSMMGDPQVMSIVRAAGAAQSSGAQGGGYEAQSRLMNDVNFCQLGRTVLMKLKGLPDGTKARLFGTLMSGDIANRFDMNVLGSRFGNQMGGSLSFKP